MIEPHGSLSQVRQCQLLNLARSTYYSQPQPISNTDLVLLRMMDEHYLKTPQYGSRSYATWFQRQGIMLSIIPNEDTGYCQYDPKTQDQYFEQTA